MESAADEFDYIVVGGGSAGCVAAHRLVVDHGARVLLLEAGPPDDSPLIRMPAGTFKMMFGESPFLKRYESTPQAHLDGRTVKIAQAHVIGGGSSVNVMAYTRGSRFDYDRWTQAAGGFPWGWDELVPFFRRQEGNRRLDNAAHGGDGPFKVTDALATAPASDLFVRTLQRLGFAYRDDFNAGELRGVGYLQVTIDKSERCSAAGAFLKPILNDSRLEVLMGARVERILFEGARAVGVQYVRGGSQRTARARAEIILTAGALVTPKLLMLSGIGPAEHLTQNGVPVRVNLPGVGQNLQDHHVVVASSTTRGRYGYFREDRGLRMLRNAFRYVAFRDGPVASNGSEVVAFTDFARADSDPDIQLYCVGVLWPSPASGAPTHGVTLMANLVKPKSRGQVRLRSADPAAAPVIDCNWLSEPQDTARLLHALKFLRQVAATAPLRDIVVAERLPGPQAQSDSELESYIRRTTETNYHPVGTCQMGTDANPMAVLTPDLRVRGTAGLRVFDASMMPTIISANTNATVMAVADRGVALMLRR